jgi:hypothetical protein
MHFLKSLLIIGTALILTASMAFAATTHYAATLSVGAEAPGKTGTGTGSTEGTFDSATSIFTYTITYSGLSGPVGAAHFHGPAGPGASAGVALGVKGDLTSPIHGEATLTADQMDGLTKGLWYVNLHTAENPKGEVRGQLLAK